MTVCSGSVAPLPGNLDVTAKVPGSDKAKILEIANAAKAGCPISRLLKANITMDAKMET